MKLLQTITILLLIMSNVCGQSMIGTTDKSAIPFMRSQGLFYYSITYQNDNQCYETYMNDSVSAAIYFKAYKHGFLHRHTHYTCIMERWNYPNTMLSKVRGQISKMCYKTRNSYEFLSESALFINVELIMIEDYFVVYYKLKN
jgi:hypothetical protein